MRRLRAPGGAFVLWATGLLGPVLPASARQNPAPAPDAASRTFTVSLKLTRGETVRYQTLTRMTLAFAGGDSSGSSYSAATGLESTLRYRVLETRKDGTFVVSVLSEGGKMIDATSETRPLPRDPDSLHRTAVLDRQSRLLNLQDPSRQHDKAGAYDALFSQTNLLVPLHCIPLPEGAVRIGTRWTVKYPTQSGKPGSLTAAPGAGKPVPGQTDDSTAMTATLTLLGIEKVGENEMLKIRQELTVPYETGIDSEGQPTGDSRKITGHVVMRMTLQQTAIVRPDDGQLLRSEGEIAGTIRFDGPFAKQLPGATMRLGGKLSVARLAENPASRTTTQSQDR